jgi:LacI family transcriptional regulator
MGWFVQEINMGVARYAREAGWILEDLASHTEVVDRKWTGDGIITLVEDPHSPLVGFLKRAKVPVVNLSSNLPQLPFARVVGDNRAIGRLGADELIHRGFQNLAFFTLGRDVPVVVGRMGGFRDAAVAAGCKFQMIDYTDEVPKGKGHQEMIRWLASQLIKLPKPLGTMAQFDADANIIVQACILAGLQVPEQVAVVGVDNDPIYSEFGPIPLTSVITNRELQGYRSAELLDKLMRGGGEAPTEAIRVPPEGVAVRRSSDILTSEDPVLSIALNFIQQHYSEAIGVDHVVMASGVSRRALYEKFSQRLGRSIHSEIVRQRLNLAKKMLCSTDLGLDAIAYDCGFSSAAALRNVFKVHEGFAPTVFRERYRHTRQSGDCETDGKAGRYHPKKPSPMSKRNPNERKNVLLAMGSFVHEINVGVARYARQAGWILEDLASHSGSINHRWAGDGIITLVEAPSSPLIPFLERAKVPVVDLTGQVPELTYPRVLPDNHHIGKLAAEELLGRGFTRLAFLALDLNAPFTAERMAGFRNAVVSAGCSFQILDYASRFKKGHTDRRAMELWLTAELENLPKPIGIMAQSDGDANIVLQACADAGIPIPEEVAVVGVDNDPIYSQLGLIPLTSVISNRELLGFRGAELLDKLMCGGKPPAGPVLVPPGGVVFRRSTETFATGDEALANALRFIREHVTSPIDVEQVVRASGVSRRSLYNRFGRVLERSIQAEIVRQRLNIAKGLLASTDDKLEVIACDSGFNGFLSFSKAFHASVGMRPSVYREKHRCPS